MISGGKDGPRFLEGNLDKDQFLWGLVGCGKVLRQPLQSLKLGNNIIKCMLEKAWLGMGMSC